MRHFFRSHFATLTGALLSFALLSASAGRAEVPPKQVVKPMSEVFSVGPPLTYTPYRGTTAVAETTLRHQIFFDDMEGSTAGWNVIDFKAGQPNAWHTVSGTQSCVGNAWWCGETTLPFGSGYGNDWAQILTTNVPITINGLNNVKLTFKYRARTEYGFDWGWVLVRGGNPGAKWDTLASYSGDFGTSCNSATLDIPDSLTTVVQPIAVRFVFGSDLSFSAQDSLGPFTGFSIDDVKVASGGNTRFFDDMEAGTTQWTTSSPDPGTLWHLENAPGTSSPASCFFLSTNVWVPFQGAGFGLVPEFADAMLTSPPMNIEGVFSPNTTTTSLRLQFDSWANIPTDNSMFWSLWIQGSNDLVTWTPWRNALWTLVMSGGNPECLEGDYVNFDPYKTAFTGVQPGTKYIRLGFRIRDQKLLNDDPGPLRMGYMTEGIYFDDIGVYYVYTISGVETVAGTPTGTRPSIRKVFPNPFNPSTKVEFSVPKEAPVAVRIFNVQGRHVATLVDKTMPAGVYRVAWNGKSDRGEDLTSGIYFAQIQSGASRQSARLTMLK